MYRKRILAAASAVACALVGLVTVASADTVAPISFDGYTPGDINGQQGWQKTGAYDVEIENVADYPAAAGYGFGLRALRMSTAVSSTSFGDHTFSPSLLNDAGEAGASSGGQSSGVHQSHFEVGFNFGTTTALEQSGLAITMSPDRGDGSRMSFIRLRDLADGVHIQFVDVDNPGPVGTVSNFVETDVATVSRTAPHALRLEMDFVDGPGNDVVRVFVDNTLVFAGTSWEDYYRFDPEQTPAGNLIPTTDSALFRISAPAVPAQDEQGYLIDGFTLTSSTPSTTTPPAGTTPAAGGTLGQTQGTAPKKCKKGRKLKKGKCVKKKRKK